ncbi:hypothetical protein FHR24_000999 [Wenyingzhuangia heitensis]|uniref:DUF5683 domain-containing protein n=1 Tax=Wenyingzhuangia heitensis TaxID=1487859 RepID=A0ABX0U9T5_9FLAO|nr:DUF5683 domain-containing protein [Wenyingzhuangia heitensis]NIJ44560.1 hypothetical protein [Wenyingzhuangia heitensis]
MNNRSFIIILIALFFHFSSFSQEKNEGNLSMDSKAFLDDQESYNALSPSKAAFYSAIIPGLGQAYNGRYWKIPIVYGALAIPTYYYFREQKTYNRYRKAYKQRQAGKVDEFSISTNFKTTETLENAQKGLRRNRDISLFFFIGLYALQIIEASIDAHLLQFNTTHNISIFPNIENETSTNKDYIALSLNLDF